MKKKDFIRILHSAMFDLEVGLPIKPVLEQLRRKLFDDQPLPKKGRK